MGVSIDHKRFQPSFLDLSLPKHEIAEPPHRCDARAHAFADLSNVCLMSLEHPQDDVETRSH